jgi:hypothetical protein
METSNIIGNIDSTTTDDGNVVVKSQNSIFSDSFCFQDYYDEALMRKFIKSTEAIIRQSKEYNDYLALIKTNYSILNYDNMMSHIGSGDASIEIHHYPFTLYDIVEIVMSHHIARGDNFTSFDLAKEIMNLHFRHEIGFVPLTTTNHELAHDGAIFISTKQIFGDWRKFAAEYDDGLNEDEREKAKRIVELSDANCATDFNHLFSKGSD